MRQYSLPLDDYNPEEGRKAYRALALNYLHQLQQQVSLGNFPVLKDRDMTVFDNVDHMSLQDLSIRKEQPHAAMAQQHSEKPSLTSQEVADLKDAINRGCLRDVRLVLGPASPKINAFKIKSIRRNIEYFKDYLDLRLNSEVIEIPLIKRLAQRDECFLSDIASSDFNDIKNEIITGLQAEHDGAEQIVNSLPLAEPLKEPAKAYYQQNASCLINSWRLKDNFDLMTQFYSLYERRNELEARLNDYESAQKQTNKDYLNISMSELWNEFQLKVTAQQFEGGADALEEKIERAKKRGFISLGTSKLNSEYTVLDYALKRIVNEYDYDATRADRSPYLDEWLKIIEEILMHDGMSKFRSCRNHVSDYRQLPWRLIRLMSFYSNPHDEDNLRVRAVLLSYSKRAVRIQKSVLMGNSMLSKGIRIFGFFSKEIFTTRGVDASVFVRMLLGGLQGKELKQEVAIRYKRAKRGVFDSTELYGLFYKQLFKKTLQFSSMSVPVLSIQAQDYAGAIGPGGQPMEQGIPLQTIKGAQSQVCRMFPLTAIGQGNGDAETVRLLEADGVSYQSYGS